MTESTLDRSNYSATQRSLHWIVFGLIAAQYAVGSIMPHIGSKTPNEGWVSWHLSLGAAILFFVLLRLLWRVRRPVALLETGPRWQQQLATAIHLTLYVLVLTMCVLGWAAANYRGWTVYLFGVVPLPDLSRKGAAWAHTAGDVHDILLYVLLAPIVLHVLAALYHQFFLRDRLLARMTFGAQNRA